MNGRYPIVFKRGVLFRLNLATWVAYRLIRRDARCKAMNNTFIIKLDV